VSFRTITFAILHRDYIRNRISQKKFYFIFCPAYLLSACLPNLRSAGFQTCCAADFQVGGTAVRPAGLETCATPNNKLLVLLARDWFH
jgi:hypothetical protein